jgi:hypothetical protein
VLANPVEQARLRRQKKPKPPPRKSSFKTGGNNG